MRSASKRDQVLSFASSHGVFRFNDVAPFGVSHSYLDDLANRGVLDKVGRGLFMSPDYDITENHSLAEATAYVPNAVICLTSALQFHGIGTQLPAAVWIALPNFTHTPKVPILLEVVRMNNTGLSAGVDTRLIEGTKVRIFNAAKTIADCFKFRDVVGFDVTLEALKDVLRKRIASPSEIYAYAATNRVANVIRPYLEALSD